MDKKDSRRLKWKSKSWKRKSLQMVEKQSFRCVQFTASIESRPETKRAIGDG